MLALDGRTYKLDRGTVVIADENGVESIAGIMGGEHSGFDETTTDVLIESALWDPLNIAQSGRKLGIITDARYRFERGVDPAFTLPGLDLATSMVMTSAAAKQARPSSPDRCRRRTVSSTSPGPRFRACRACQCSPQNRSASSKNSASRLRARATGERDAAVVASGYRGQGGSRRGGHPHRRPRPHRAATSAAPRSSGGQADPDPDPEAHPPGQAPRSPCADWSRPSPGRSSPRTRRSCSAAAIPRLALANPIASDLSDMRPSLLPGLLKAAQRNADRGFGDVALFEVGQSFASDEPEGQSIKAAAVRRGTARAEGVGRHWNGGGRASMPSTPRRTRWRCWRRSAFRRAVCRSSPAVRPGSIPARSGTLQFGPKNVIGAFGEIHPNVLKALDLKGPLVAFELTLDALPPPKAKPTKMKPKLVLLRLPAAHPRLRLRGRARRGGGRHRQGGARRRAPAHRRRRRVRRLRGRGHRPGQEVGGDRRDPPADGEDPDRRGDRGRLAPRSSPRWQRRRARCCAARHNQVIPACISG